jgi:hypothetical protein
MTESFTSAHSKVTGPGARGVLARPRKAGRTVVDIFTPFSHPVITVIWLLMRGMAPFRRAEFGGGRVGPDSGWTGASRARRRGSTADNPAVPSGVPVRVPNPSTPADRFPDDDRAICPHPTPDIHRFGLVVHSDRRENRFRCPAGVARLAPSGQPQMMPAPTFATGSPGLIRVARTPCAEGAPRVAPGDI